MAAFRLPCLYSGLPIPHLEPVDKLPALAQAVVSISALPIILTSKELFSALPLPRSWRITNHTKVFDESAWPEAFSEASMPWVRGRVPRYRLTRAIVRRYLRKRFGDLDFGVQVCNPSAVRSTTLTNASEGMTTLSS